VPTHHFKKKNVAESTEQDLSAENEENVAESLDGETTQRAEDVEETTTLALENTKEVE
jgi:hypothetical protein